MNINDLSQEDQELLNTDLGDFEKAAAEKLQTVEEMYTYGHDKLASEIAEGIDELVKAAAEEEDEEEKDEGMDEESEKSAAEFGAFIERGVFDGLSKLGSDNHNDPMYYFYPFMEEKIAAAGATAAKAKAFGSKSVDALKAQLAKAQTAGKKGVAGAKKQYHQGMADARLAATGKQNYAYQTKGGKNRTKTIEHALTSKPRLQAMGRTGARVGGAGGTLAAGGYLASRKKDQN